jgi:hypothetical protein
MPPSAKYLNPDGRTCIRPTADCVFFRCTVAGTTGAVEPFWPTIIGNTVEDGTVTWMAVSIISGDLQAPDPSAVIELFQLELNAAQHGVNETYYFHAGVNATGNNGNIIWNSQEYLAFPTEADGFEYSGNGQLPRPKIRISNVLSTITALLLTLPDGLEGAKFTRIRTLGRYLDSANFPASGDILLTEDSFALLLEDDGSILLEPTNPTEDPTAEFPREVYYVDRKVVETATWWSLSWHRHLILLVFAHPSGSVLPTFVSGYINQPSVAIAVVCLHALRP